MTTKQGTLSIFDIDDTLFKSDTKIIVRKNNKEFKTLSTREFAKYQLGIDETFDFSEFRSGQIFFDRAIPIDNVFYLAKTITENNIDPSFTMLLTARSDFHDKEAFLEKFKHHGFPIDKAHVERAGNLHKLKYGVKPHILKAAIVNRYLKTNKYNSVKMWDDSEDNLEMFLKLSNFYPEMQFEAFCIKEDGRIERYRMHNERD